jgi:multiple sugar transport system substrate-binding protein
MIMMKNRKLLIAIFLVITSVLAWQTGCSKGNKAGNVADDKEEIILRFAWWGSQVRTDATLSVIDMYTAKTGIKIEPEYTPFDSYFTKFNTLAAADDLYDLFQLGGGASTYAEQIESIEPYIEKGLIDVTDIEPAILNTNLYDGKLLGLTLGINSYGAMAYDPALFAEAGVPEPADDWTWADFEYAAMTIHEKLGIFGSSKINDSQAGFSMMYFDTGNHQIFNDTLTGLGYTDDAPIVNYFKMKQRLTDAGAYPDSGRISEIKDIEGDLLVTKEAAMTWISSNQFIALSSAAGRSLKPAFIPRRDKTAPSATQISSSQMLSIYNKSKYKEEAAKFISFFVNDIEANKILKGERGIPAPAAVRAALSEDLDEAGQKLYAFMDGVAATGSFAPSVPPEGQEIADQYTVLHEQVMAHQIMPEEAAVQLRKFAEEVFARSAKTK